MDTCLTSIVSISIEMDTSYMMESANEPKAGTGRPETGIGSKLPPRRQYTLDLKRRIVEETFVPGALVSIVARRHNVNANQLFGWRKRYREGTLNSSTPASKATTLSGKNLIRVGVIGPGFDLRPDPVGDSSAPSPAAQQNGGTGGAGIIEIELPNRVKLRVPAGIGEAELRRVLAVARQSA